MASVLVEYNQNIFDIAIQECGSAEAVFDVLANNATVLTSINDELVPGTKLKVPAEPANVQVLSYLKSKSIRMASNAVTALAGEGFLLSEDDVVLTDETKTALKPEDSELLEEGGDNLTEEGGDNLTM
jgi:hypothetical protein